jgi:hypothetical protein
MSDPNLPEVNVYCFFSSGLLIAAKVRTVLKGAEEIAHVHITI